jgi:hypothetical protein
MDLLKIINDLRQEREKLDAIINSLAQLQDTGPSAPPGPISRRGRRSMDAAGRLEVSQRMKKYWDERRKLEGQDHNPSQEGLSVVKSLSA